MPSEAPFSPPPSQSTRGPLRWLLLGLGGLFTGIAVLGAFLPVLPTTPFLLLAMAAFSRSSPSLQRKLMEAPVFGVYLRQWDHDRSIPRHAKWKAYGLIVVTIGLSAFLVDSLPVRLVLFVVGAALIAFLASRPTTEHELRDYMDGESQETERPRESADTGSSPTARPRERDPAQN